MKMKEKKAIFPGSFDPITLGHLDIVERASEMFDQLTILIMKNEDKTSFFTAEKRKEMIESVIENYPNVHVEIGEGLTVNYARAGGYSYLVRGIRTVTDYEYEMQVATANMMLAKEIDTVFLLTKPELSATSSSTVRAIAKNKGDLSKFVPKRIIEQLNQLIYTS